jgi:hypothetical protein
MSDRNQDQAAPASREALESKPKYLDKSESRPIVLGRLQTDEEARLAAEIEKLRDKV